MLSRQYGFSRKYQYICNASDVKSIGKYRGVWISMRQMLYRLHRVYRQVWCGDLRSAHLPIDSARAKSHTLTLIWFRQLLIKLQYDGFLPTESEMSNQLFSRYGTERPINQKICGYLSTICKWLPYEIPLYTVFYKVRPEGMHILNWKYAPGIITSHALSYGITFRPFHLVTLLL